MSERKTAIFVSSTVERSPHSAVEALGTGPMDQKMQQAVAKNKGRVGRRLEGRVTMRPKMEGEGLHLTLAVEQDPYEVNNLVADPKFAAKLAELRAALQQWTKAVGDMGAVPETERLRQLWNGGNAPPATATP